MIRSADELISASLSAKSRVPSDFPRPGSRLGATALLCSDQDVMTAYTSISTDGEAVADRAWSKSWSKSDADVFASLYSGLIGR